jgi:hypothetical protein
MLRYELEILSPQDVKLASLSFIMMLPFHVFVLGLLLLFDFVCYLFVCLSLFRCLSLLLRSLFQFVRLL